MDETEYRVGQVVVKDGRYGKPVALLKVAAVGKKKITLTDRSEWNARTGREWGASRDALSWSHIRPATADDILFIETNRLCRFLEQRSLWESLPIETLRAVYRIVKDARNSPATDASPESTTLKTDE